MTGNDTSGEARKGLFDSVAGKAKEVAGALTGKDALTEEGQLQQADAQARRAANSEQAIADAQARTAAEELQQEQRRAAEEQRAAYAKSGAQQQAVQHEAVADRVNAEAAAQREEQAGQQRAGADAARNVRETVADAQAGRAEAQATEQAAEQQRETLLAAAHADERRATELRHQALTSEGELS